jgi:hypothetical protein
MILDWLYAASSINFFLYTNLRPKKHFAGTAYRSGGPGSIRIAIGYIGGDDKPDIKDRYTGYTGQKGTKVQTDTGGYIGQKGIKGVLRVLRDIGLRGVYRD